mgnify:CR=1 FL=1
MIENPRFGRLYGREEIWLLNLPRTPFAFVYHLTQDRIEILRVADQRSVERKPWPGTMLMPPSASAKRR